MASSPLPVRGFAGLANGDSGDAKWEDSGGRSTPSTAAPTPTPTTGRGTPSTPLPGRPHSGGLPPASRSYRGQEPRRPGSSHGMVGGGRRPQAGSQSAREDVNRTWPAQQSSLDVRSDEPPASASPSSGS
eukprot:CAMPEP_0203915322 /NCGR_PEP_ID=MMETSP0359-20131031/56132_1 /ASSEMBLY_ACC=CAM_ASM_000338 /TAXON_ID=268821 /ORGANISM="Scrippsiella Hangoei, Strain SHTV-5" /LENGTH=129 /DNA_ID=CAMNT_0050841805 /DNA_START=101 /DNA_END=486 /DNA_ORIENTATION=+